MLRLAFLNIFAQSLCMELCHFSFGSVLLVAMLGISVAQEPEVDPSELPPIPAVSPDEALATFKITPGFALELVAAEPLVEDPVAMAFDEYGRLFVAEMRGYSERRDEELGRIRLLEDRDGDGRFETASIYAEGLSWPTGLACYDGGIFVADSPEIIFFRDTTGDGKADERKVVYEGFAAGMAEPNVQALLNSLTWGADGRLYGATAGNGGRVSWAGSEDEVDLRGADFSFDPVRPESLRRESGTAQFGLSFDPWGNRYVCSNSRHLMQVVYEQRPDAASTFYPMPHPLVNIPVDGAAAEVFRISEDEPWRTVRTSWRVSGLVSGIVEGGGRVSGYFTSASGVTIYGGDALGESVVGQAFVGDVGSNLVHRKTIDRSGIVHSAERVAGEEDREFLASTDRWFRPVAFANGPEGALYVADMYREVIEHPLSLPQNIKRHLDLNSGFQRGRIYRVVPSDFNQPVIPRIGEMDSESMVRLLDHPNVWHRETAARLLASRTLSAEALDRVRVVAKEGERAAGRILAYSLVNEGIASAVNDPDPSVRAWGVRLLGSGLSSQDLKRLSEDPDPRVRFELALSLASSDVTERQFMIERLFVEAAGERWLEAAALQALRNAEEAVALFETLFVRRTDLPKGTHQLITLLIRIAETARPDLLAATLQTLLTDELEDEDDLDLLTQALATLPKRSVALNELVDTPNLLDGWRMRVLSALSDTSLGEGKRMIWLKLAPAFLRGNDADQLWKIVIDDRSEEVRLGAAKGLLDMNRPDTSERFLEEWSQINESIRQLVLQRMMARESEAVRWLTAMEEGKVSRSLIASHERSNLQRSRNAEIAALANQVFPAPSGEARKEAIAQFYPAVTMDGDAASGKVLFEQRCALCHRSEGEGFELGPDRESFANKGKGLLLVHLIDPNREIAPQYYTTQVTTSAGESYAGRLVSQTAEEIHLRAPLGVEHQWRVGDVENVETLDISLMPPGLEGGLSLQEMADLLSYVEGGAK